MRAPNCATGPLRAEHSIVTHGGGTGNRIVPLCRSGRPDRLGRLTGVSQDQPSRQQVGRLFRRGAVKGHQRCRHSGQASKLRPPSVADQRDLYLIGTAGDVVFEAMNDHRRLVFVEETEAEILRGRYVWSSEARREDDVHTAAGDDRQAFWTKKNLPCQLLHSFCTIHAQLFHTSLQIDMSSRKTIEQVE